MSRTRSSPVISNTLRVAAAGRPHHHVAAVVAQALHAAHQDRQAGGVDQLGPGDVDRQVAGPVLDQAHERRAELRGGVAVQVAPDVHHGRVIGGRDGDLEVEVADDPARVVPVRHHGKEVVAHCHRRSLRPVPEGSEEP